MNCQRCNSTLEFITIENRRQYKIFEYLCTKCLCYYQEYYEGMELVKAGWGDLRARR